MNIKEGVRKLVEQYVYIDKLSSEKITDQILDLVLNALTVEKETTIGVGHSYRMDGFNECVDAYEELKNKLRK